MAAPAGEICHLPPMAGYATTYTSERPDSLEVYSIHLRPGKRRIALTGGGRQNRPRRPAGATGT